MRIALVLAMAVLPSIASTNSLETAYISISTYRAGPVASAEGSLFTSPAGLIAVIR